MELSGFGDNRISRAIDKCKEVIQGKLDKNEITPEQLETARVGFDLSMEEYVKFQELKSLASMDGGLSLDEAQLVYRYLGEVPCTFNNQPFHVKMVLNEVFVSLLKRQIERRGTVSV